MQVKTKWLLLFPAMPLAALIVFAFVFERRTVIGQSSTRSPNGEWCLTLELTEYSNLLKSRKILDANVEYFANTDWTVKTSMPLDIADARTISNLDPDHPIVWSGDSTTVSYWINDRRDDVIEIEADENYYRFRRKLCTTSITIGPKPAGG